MSTVIAPCRSVTIEPTPNMVYQKRKSIVTSVAITRVTHLIIMLSLLRFVVAIYPLYRQNSDFASSFYQLELSISINLSGNNQNSPNKV